MQRIYKSKRVKADSPWLSWVLHNRTNLSILSILYFLAGIFFLFLSVVNNLQVLLILFISSLICVFYVVPVRSKSLRERAMLKAPIVALIWTVLIVIIPLIDRNHHHIIYRWDLWAFLIYFIALTIPFDIRDLRYDLPGQKTIPQLFGEKKSRLITVLFVLISSVLFVMEWSELSGELLFYLSIFYIVIIVLGGNQRKSDNYFILIDVSMIFLGLSFLSIV